MNPTPLHSNDPDPQLARGLRATTPEFESRFDDLRRRLAHEGVPPSRWSVFTTSIRRSHLFGAAVALALIVVALVALWRDPASTALQPGDPEAWYLEAAVLDESLQGALVLTDASAREALMSIDSENQGGGS